METIRLNKYLSDQGICSRREADRRIEAGQITIDGRPAKVGEKVTGQEKICCCGTPVEDTSGGKRKEYVLLAVNKPRGIVCTTSDKDRAPNVVDLIDYPERIYPVGRLDKDSEGLILMTNQGEIANQIIHAGNLHEKEYVVTVDRPFDQDFVRRMQRGVELRELGETTRPCRVKVENARTFRIILTQGLNRQIRRMCRVLGYKVISLKRVRIMNILLGSLDTGEFRRITQEEQAELERMLKQNRNGRLPERVSCKNGNRRQDV